MRLETMLDLVECHVPKGARIGDFACAQGNFGILLEMLDLLKLNSSYVTQLKGVRYLMPLGLLKLSGSSAARVV